VTRVYNKESVQGFRVNSLEEVENGGPGAFCWIYGENPNIPEAFVHYLPGSGLGVCWIRGGGIEHPKSTWDWNGNLDKPTLRPSIHAQGGIGWHGWLTDGYFKSC
jgi:hypothetical protein